MGPTFGDDQTLQICTVLGNFPIFIVQLFRGLVNRITTLLFGMSLVMSFFQGEATK